MNPKHKIIEKINDNLKLRNGASADNDEELVKLIFDQACIVGGDPVSDVGSFSKRVNDILYKALLSNTPVEQKQSLKVKVKKS